MKGHSDARERMADLFDSIPTIVSDCEDYVGLYRKQHRLQLHVDNIYIALLSAMEDMICWYTKSSKS